MAKKLEFGMTPAGQFFISILYQFMDAERLNRGRLYALEGKVLDCVIDGGKVKAVVEGSFEPYYHVALSFAQATGPEKSALDDYLFDHPGRLAEFDQGILSTEFIKELALIDINLMPTKLKELGRSCTCPDSADPCKHMASVYFYLSQLIDQDPRLIFKLRGFELKEAKPPVVLDEPILYFSSPGFELPSPQPQWAVRDSYLNFVMSLLKARPPFWVFGDFRTLVLEVYHSFSRNHLTKNQTGEDFRGLELEPVALKSLARYDEVRFKASWGSKNRAASALDLVSMAAEFQDDFGSSHFTFIYQLSILYHQVCQAFAFVPKLWQTEDQFGVYFHPLCSIEELRTAICSLAHLSPGLFVLDSGETLNKASEVELFLTLALTQAVGLCNLNPKYEDHELFDVFFKAKPAKTKHQAFVGTPLAIRTWLSVFDSHQSNYKYRIIIGANKKGFTLSAQASIDGKSYIDLKNCATNEQYVRALSFVYMVSNYVPELVDLVNKGSVPLDLERLKVFVKEGQFVLRHLGVEVLMPKALAKELRPSLRLKQKRTENYGYKLGIDEVAGYEWSIDLGDESMSLDEFRALLAQSKDLIFFREGYSFLDADEVQGLLKKAKKSPGLDDVITEYARGEDRLDQGLRSRLDNLFRPKTSPLPQNLKAELRPYQLSGFSWLWSQFQNGFGSILADDMGLGKTLQTIGLIAKIKEEGQLQVGVLVVVPASLIANWSIEVQKFAPFLRYQSYYGKDRRLSGDADVVITSYETLLRDFDALSQTTWDSLILDEAHGLKNAQTKRAQAVKAMKSRHRLALTGTPVENRLEDLRSIFDFVMPGYLGTQADFRRKYRIPIELDRNESVAAELKTITQPFLLRRLKTDPTIAPDLPAKTVIEERCSLTPNQGALYQSFVDKMLAEVKSAHDQNTRNVVLLRLMTGLKQICNHPRAYDKKSEAKVGLSGKAQLLVELISGIIDGREKVLVFSQYVETLAILDEILLAELGIKALVLTGETKVETRQVLVDKFQNEAQHLVFLISLKAGGVGLNLTAANHVIHYDLWFNPAVENQASDRAYRIGQKKQVFVHRLITQGSFEEKIDALIKSKVELANMTVAQGESWLSDLSPEDLSRLFQKD